jgi:hypothetical protein
MADIDAPKIAFFVPGEVPGVDEPETLVTLPYPPYDESGAIRTVVEDSVKEETLSMRRVTDVTGTKYRYELNFENLPSSDLFMLQTKNNFTVPARDIYFKYDRWAESSDWVQVTLDIGPEMLVAGLLDSDRNYFVKCTIVINEVVNRI